MSNAQGTTGKLAGKTYIVTGAAQGIGRAEAEHLASLSAAAQAIDDRAIFVRHDVSSKADWAAV